jgi:hypothetical protein
MSGRLRDRKHGSQNTGMAAGVKPRSREAVRLFAQGFTRDDSPGKDEWWLMIRAWRTAIVRYPRGSWHETNWSAGLSIQWSPERRAAASKAARARAKAVEPKSVVIGLRRRSNLRKIDKRCAAVAPAGPMAIGGRTLYCRKAGLFERRERCGAPQRS